jgi:serine O-acetyltransferase
MKPIGILIFFRLKSRYGVDLSPWAIVDPGIRLMHAFGIVVGPNVRIQKGTKIFHHVTLGKSRPDREALLMPTIGRYCILGAGAKILGPVKIPDRSLVPANMLITGKKLSQGMMQIPAASSDWCDHVELVLSCSNPSKVPLQ